MLSWTPLYGFGHSHVRTYLLRLTLPFALASKDEVLDLEAAGVKIIQIDEAALRENHSRRSDWAMRITSTGQFQLSFGTLQL